MADLGVLLPLTLALVTLNGVNAASAFAVIGFAYLVNAFAYRLPVPVQPLKSLSATALALGLSPGVVNAGAWWMAAIFLVLAATNATRLVQRLFPRPVVRGIQLGLALVLLRSAWTLIQPGEVWLTLALILLLFIFLLIRREWAALAVIASGLIIAILRNGVPELSITPVLSVPDLPQLIDFGSAFWLLALPQIPLSLANSIYSTADAAHQYFGDQAARV